MNQLPNLLLIASVAVYSVGAEQKGNRQLRCMDTPRHKARPSEEPSLQETCNAYSGLSCCVNETAARIQGKDLYQLHRLTCNKPMSSGCKKFFQHGACLYECSPHLGQYIVDDNVGESLQNVPLCQSECEKWFTACINDFTCTLDWKTAHENTHFTCTSKDKCQTFRDKFQSAEHFCKTVWGNMYTTVPDDQDCVKIDVTSEHVENKTAVFMDEKNNSQKETAVFFTIVLPIIVSNFI